MSTHLNDTIANCVELPSKWHGLFMHALMKIIVKFGRADDILTLLAIV